MIQSRVSRRHLLAGLLPVLAAVAFVACSRNALTAPNSPSNASVAVTSPSSTMPEATQTARKATPGVVTWLVRAWPTENEGQEKIFEPILKQQFPDLTVNRIVIPMELYIPKINTMAAANESIEIWGFGGNYMDYWARRLPQNLDSYVSGDK